MKLREIHEFVRQHREKYGTELDPTFMFHCVRKACASYRAFARRYDNIVHILDEFYEDIIIGITRAMPRDPDIGRKARMFVGFLYSSLGATSDATTIPTFYNALDTAFIMLSRLQSNAE